MPCQRAKDIAAVIVRILLAFSCVLFLPACVPKKPYVSQEPDTARIKSRASQKPYTVYGERYEPMETHAGFVQNGIASWYGKDFHGKITSNGERYDMNAMTAAHKTLPLGVYVKVTNTDNGREAVVRVNDRGPFVKGRIIDLSYAAAKKLGLDVVGTAPVHVEALGYRRLGTDSYQAVDNYDIGNYTVQVGAFKDYNNARRLSSEMKKLVGFSDIHEANINGDTFYRVYAGRFTSLSAAEKAEQDFSDHGYPGSFTVALE